MVWIRFNDYSESKEFCQSFVENGNKISFIFKRMLIHRKFVPKSNDPNSTVYHFQRVVVIGKFQPNLTLDLFIGSYYWRIFIGQPDYGLKWYFEDETGRVNNQNYSMATKWQPIYLHI